MIDRAAPRPYKSFGLVIFFIFNIIGWMMLSVFMADAINYERGTGASISMAQAAYVTAQWTKVVAYGAGLISFNIAIVGIAICSCISALHEAVIWTGSPKT